MNRQVGITALIFAPNTFANVPKNCIVCCVCVCGGRGGERGNIHRFCTQNTSDNWNCSITITQPKHAALNPCFFTFSTAHAPREWIILCETHMYGKNLGNYPLETASIISWFYAGNKLKEWKIKSNSFNVLMWQITECENLLLHELLMFARQEILLSRKHFKREMCALNIWRNFF